MTRYYVNKETGSDGNSGRSTSSAFETVGKVNSLSLRPGDEVLFAKGQTWKETLKPRTSGTDDDPITFGTYGSGSKDAVFDGARGLKYADWDKVGTNKWQTDVPKAGYLDPGKLYINGEGAKPESSSIGRVDSPGDWRWTGGELTIYATSNPRGRDIALQVRDEGIRLDNRDNLVFEDLTTKRAFNGVALYEGADDNRFDDVTSHRNTLHGFWIRDSDDTVLDGVRSYKNGQVTTTDTSARTGEGVFLDARSSDTVIKNAALHDNAQHGVNFSHLTGDGHKIQNVTAHGNGEAGLAIAGGNQSVTGSRIYDNDLGGIVATLNAETITLKDNIITAPTDKNLHALYARGAGDARFVSEDNKYKGDAGHVIYLQSEAGDRSTFKDDLIVASKTKQYLPLVWLEGGRGHVFDDVSFVSKASRGVPIMVAEDASTTVKNSFVYGTGHSLVLDRDGSGYRGVNNNYFKPDTKDYWITKASRNYSEADIDAGRVDTDSSTKTMTPSQMESAWAAGRNPVSLGVRGKDAPVDDLGVAEDVPDEVATPDDGAVELDGDALWDLSADALLA